ncbi:hypothetical protein [Streptomyces anandii]|uniref:hypothetical protein n=1 Tax=Streptomyces anandii TaxID=285454 RepID=UPI0037A2A067
MPGRTQVQRLPADGLGHAEAGRRLWVPAGQAFLIATGLRADGGDTLTTDRWSNWSRGCACTWRSRMPCSPGCGRIFRGRTASSWAPRSSGPEGRTGHPHPHGPQHPPAAVAAAALMDRARDKAGGRPAERKGTEDESRSDVPERQGPEPEGPPE